MKRKLFAVGVCLTMLFAQTSFVFAQTSAPARSTDELIGLLNEPEAVAVVNVRKMLSEIAPTLLNKDALLLAKLASAMREIELESGINPYSIDKIVVGIKFSTEPDEFMLIIQSDSSAKLMDGVYQNQLNTAKLANETNPLKERIFQVQNRLDNERNSGETEKSNEYINADLDKLTNAALELETAAEALTRTTLNQALIDQTKIGAEQIRQTLEKIRLDFNERIKSDDFDSRLDALEKQAKEIKLGDQQRAAKIADLGKQLAAIDSESAGSVVSGNNVRQVVSLGLADQSAAALENALKQIKSLPNSEAARTPIYRQMQKQLAEMQKTLDYTLAEMKTVVAPQPLPVDKNATQKADVYPFSTVVTRKDETLEGRKMAIITTVKKYGGDEPDKVETSAMFATDERTLMLGDRQTIAASLAGKNPERNRTTRDLIAKSGDALVALGVDLKAVSLRDFGEIWGEQKNAWQIFGALSSQGNDLTLEATVEKTDRPLVLTAKPAEEKPKTSELSTVGDKNFVTEIMDLLVKSVVGIEGKFTVRFEKKKGVAMIEEFPKLLRKWSAGNQSSTVKVK